MNSTIKKKLIMKIGIPAVGAIVLILFFMYVLTPYVQKQMMIMGANTMLKPEAKCQKFVEQFVVAMQKKETTAIILEQAKEEGCRR